MFLLFLLMFLTTQSRGERRNVRSCKLNGMTLGLDKDRKIRHSPLINSASLVYLISPPPETMSLSSTHFNYQSRTRKIKKIRIKSNNQKKPKQTLNSNDKNNSNLKLEIVRMINWDIPLFYTTLVPWTKKELWLCVVLLFYRHYGDGRLRRPPRQL